MSEEPEFDAAAAWQRIEKELRSEILATRRANRFLDALLDNIPSMVFVKEAAELRFVRLNRAGESLLGLSRVDLIGKNDFDFFPKEEAEFFQAKDREALRGGKLVEIPEEPIVTPRGERWLHTRKVPLYAENGEPAFLLGISLDVTEARLIAAERARLAAIVDSSDDAIMSMSLDGVLHTWNPGAERLFGYVAAEAIERRVAELIPVVPDSFREEAARHVERLRRGERVPPFDSRHRTKSGTVVDVSVTLSLLRDAAGEPVGLSAILRDIGELKRAQRELIAAKETAEGVSKELEAFSYSVAHDLRTPLRAIDGFSQALIEDFAPTLDTTGQKYLGFVREAAQHMAELIDDLLTLSRVTRDDLVLAPVDLSASARAAVGRLERANPNRRVEVRIAEGMTARGDARLLSVVLDNLLGNAWKFSARRDVAHVEVGCRDEANGERVFFVKDDGAGFDMAYADKLFGVFQRLHGARDFEGTGIGLATVQRIVARHRGRVWAEGTVGAGATFSFTLGDDHGETET